MARMLIRKTLGELTEDIKANNQEKGWHDEPRTVSDYVALAVGELSEAHEEHRNGKGFNEVYYKYTMTFTQTVPEGARPIVNRLVRNMEVGVDSFEPGDALTKEEMRVLVEAGIAKPEGVAIEFIDCIIRCLDALGAEGCDVEELMDLKMAYNKTRPYRHGGKAL